MTNKKLKIFITQIGHPSLKGGGNAVAHNFSELFSKRGHDVSTIYVSPINFLSEKPKTAYRMIFIKKASKLLPIINCLKTALIIKKLSNNKENRPDVIISLGYEGLLIPLIKAKSILFIAANHNFLRPVEIKDFLNWKWLNPLKFGKILYLISVFFDKLTKLKADFVQSLCEFGAEQCQMFYKVPKNKIFIVPNGINEKEFIVRSMPKNKIILFIGSAVEHKGLDILICSLPIIIKAHPDIEVWVLGEKNKRDGTLIDLAEQIGVSSQINRYGLIRRDDMPEFYQKARIVVLPSRLDLFPMTALEAMSSGVPLVATKVGGLPEIINNGINGLLVEKDDINGLAGAIVYFLDNPEKAEEMGRMGREIVEQKFTLEKVVEKYEQKIYNLLK